MVDVRERAPAPPPRTGRWLSRWEPEDSAFWLTGGRRVARRNLAWSMFVEHLSFNVWTLWSIVAAKLAGRHFSVDELFWLVSLPTLVGASLRLPYTFAPARFGGRNWTTFSASLLLVPAVLLTLALRDPGTPYWVFLAVAALAGVGGANHASSMANISRFYPSRRQGLALGLNAASGNIGVSVVQLLVPLVVGSLGLLAAGWMWIPLALVAAIGAHTFMDNLSTSGHRPRRRLRAWRYRQTWAVSWLYIGTFGSFVGLSTALPLLTKVQFPQADGAWYLFLGPLVGAGARPAGGWLADRLTGARVTLWNFLIMTAGAIGALVSLLADDYPLFLAAFLLLFVTAGIGNGSTYRMIPVIFRERAVRAVATDDRAAYRAAIEGGRQDTAAAFGIASAIGALGGFLVSRGFGWSIAQTGTAATALAVLAGCYLLCLVVTWFSYLRGEPLVRRRNLADSEL